MWSALAFDSLCTCVGVLVRVRMQAETRVLQYVVFTFCASVPLYPFVDLILKSKSCLRFQRYVIRMITCSDTRGALLAAQSPEFKEVRRKYYQQVCGRACTCVWARLRVPVLLCECVCVCLCLCVRGRKYACACACMCALVRFWALGRMPVPLCASKCMPDCMCERACLPVLVGVPLSVPV